MAAVTDGYTPVKHRQSGEVAFYFKDPASGEPLTAARTLLLDGTHPIPGSELRCGSCGQPVSASRHDLDWSTG